MISSNDQIIKILKEIGLQSPNDASYITDKEVLKYFNNVQSSIQVSDSNKKLTGLKKEYYEIIMSLLKFNPYHRVSAEACLKNPIFDKIRLEELETQAPYKIALDIDKDGILDYE